MAPAPGYVESIVVGVISGVLTSIAVAAILLFIRKVAVPWYQSITYSGINLSGTWHAVDPTMAQRIELTITQTAKNIKGQAIFSHVHGEDDDERPFDYEPTRTFSLTGITQDRFVTLTLRHTNIDRLGINCYLLEVIGDGRRMAGVFSFYSVNTNQIGDSYHLLYRDRSEADRVSMQARKDLKERQKELLEELKENERKIEATDPDQVGDKDPD